MRARPRRPDDTGPEAVPDWLVRFDAADWWDDGEQPPAWWVHGASVWRGHRARRRWSDAGHAWLAEHEYPRSAWFALVHPRSAGYQHLDCGRRLGP